MLCFAFQCDKTFQFYIIFDFSLSLLVSRFQFIYLPFAQAVVHYRIKCCFFLFCGMRMKTPLIPWQCMYRTHTNQYKWLLNRNSYGTFQIPFIYTKQFINNKCTNSQTNFVKGFFFWQNFNSKCLLLLSCSLALSCIFHFCGCDSYTDRGGVQ